MANRLIKDPTLTSLEVFEAQEVMRLGSLLGKHVILTYSILSNPPEDKRSWHTIEGVMFDDPDKLRLGFKANGKILYLEYKELFSPYKIKELVAA